MSLRPSPVLLWVTAALLPCLPARGDVEGTWVSPAPLAIARQETAAARIGDTVYVVGGLVSPLAAIGSVEAYDIATDSWSFVAPLPEPRDHAAAAVVDGLLYLIGGYAGDFEPVDDVFVHAPQPDS